MFVFNEKGIISGVSKMPITWIDLGLSILLLAAFAFIYIKLNKGKISIVIASVLCGVTILAWMFSLHFVWMIFLLIIVALLTRTIIQQQKELSDLLISIINRKKHLTAEKVYDRHAICQKIALAVDTLSKTKTGALITFEKGVKLNEVVKTGTMLHAPVTPELLVTIFYPGTRLHDGAVVIRRDEILAASVYYTPTTKPLTGKFGSRHRAAIGISEITDSVTVIVSEETGRISIAYGGELIAVAPDSFLRTLEDYLFTEAKKEEN